MTIHMTETKAHLEGDWTLVASALTIDSLVASLQQINPDVEQRFEIDCGNLKSVDRNGLDLLNVWMQCFRFRGVEPVLVNIPEQLSCFLRCLDFRVSMTAPLQSVEAGV